MSGEPLGDRMKGYENAFRISLPKRMPVIVRVDGRAFHTFTRGMQKPFDAEFMSAMDAVALALCKEAQGAVFAFAQSDEVSILLHNYKRLGSQPWFDNNLQKIASVSASIATAAMIEETNRDCAFDARAFVLPEAEVVNYFIWRQQDATRNSILSVAQSLYSHAELLGKNASQQQEMIFQRGQNWNDLKASLKRGRSTMRVEPETEILAVFGDGWVTDHDNPIFSQDRSYVERHLAIEEET